MAASRRVGRFIEQVAGRRVSAAVGEIPGGFVQGGARQHAEHREKMIVAGRLRGAAMQAGLVEAGRAAIAGRGPHHHRHLGLRRRGDRVGHTVQEELVLAE
jgi:hypothetical protein